MPHVQSLSLPRRVVEDNRLVLANDFLVEPRLFCFGPDGRLHVLSPLFYNYYRYDKSDGRTFSTYLVDVHGPDLGPERIADFSDLRRVAERGEHCDHHLFDPSLTVTPGNLVALTTRANRTFLFDAGLEATLRGQPDVVVLHESPEVAGRDCRGKQGIRDCLLRHPATLVVCGHGHWPSPLQTLANGTQVCNVDVLLIVAVR
jgi:hypothetical protein